MTLHKDNTSNTKRIHDGNDYTSTDLVVEGQIARHIVDLLNDKAQHLSMAEAQRLATARNHAVNQLAHLQSQLNSHHGIHRDGNVLQWFGHYVSQHKIISSALVIGAMLLTFFAVQQLELNNNLESSDAFLLASDLPPEAYADKGFDTWLSSKL